MVRKDLYFLFSCLLIGARIIIRAKGSLGGNAAQHCFLGNGQKPEYPMLFCPKTDVPENNRGRECLKKNLNAPRPSEHPPVRGKKCQNV